MKTRFRLIHRGVRGKQLYRVDSETGRRFSLRAKDRDAAEQVVLAKNQSLRQPSLNLQIAKAYLAGTDSGVAAAAIDLFTRGYSTANLHFTLFIPEAVEISMRMGYTLCLCPDLSVE